MFEKLFFISQQTNLCDEGKVVKQKDKIVCLSKAEC